MRHAVQGPSLHELGLGVILTQRAVTVAIDGLLILVTLNQILSLAVQLSLSLLNFDLAVLFGWVDASTCIAHFLNFY